MPEAGPTSISSMFNKESPGLGSVLNMPTKPQETCKQIHQHLWRRFFLIMVEGQSSYVTAFISFKLETRRRVMYKAATVPSAQRYAESSCISIIISPNFTSESYMGAWHSGSAPALHRW